MGTALPGRMVVRDGGACLCAEGVGGKLRRCQREPARRTRLRLPEPATRRGHGAGRTAAADARRGDGRTFEPTGGPVQRGGAGAPHGLQPGSQRAAAAAGTDVPAAAAAWGGRWALEAPQVGNPSPPWGEGGGPTGIPFDHSRMRGGCLRRRFYGATPALVFPLHCSVVPLTPTLFPEGRGSSVARLVTLSFHPVRQSRRSHELSVTTVQSFISLKV